jgi:hypothetical protein
MLRTKASKRAAILLVLWLITCVTSTAAFLLGAGPIALIIAALTGYGAVRMARTLGRREARLARNRRRNDHHIIRHN